MTKKMYYIDLFAGCGGLSTGLQNAGWTGLFAIEKNSDAFSTLKFNLIKDKNHFCWPSWLPIKECDINELLKVHRESLNTLSGKVDLVAGGPPCQGFSMAGKRNKDDQRNKLVKSYIRMIRIIRPKAIMFENVYGFTIHFKGKKGTKQYSSYVERALKRMGYHVKHKMVDISEYGVPQKRIRFILIALQEGDPQIVFELLDSKRDSFCKKKGIAQITTVNEAIGDLEKRFGTCPSPDTKGFAAGGYGPAESGYQEMLRAGLEGTETLPADSHRFVNHREGTIKLHTDLLEKAPRGKRITPEDHYVENLNRRGVTVLDPNAQAPTVTSIPDEIVHYSEPRILTVRECARLQSFPDWFQFKGKYTSGGMSRKHEVPRYTQVGNAVPPLFAEQIGIALREVLVSGNKTGKPNVSH